eukprot:GHVS01108538.1.p1 GENE.GHVS01108538.1~~GHVS01108538.1.p1  ORF type:complete len:623 (-),score=212.47 GHVS01108538.1:139-2007(-)
MKYISVLFSVFVFVLFSNRPSSAFLFRLWNRRRRTNIAAPSVHHQQNLVEPSTKVDFPPTLHLPSSSYPPHHHHEKEETTGPLALSLLAVGRWRRRLFVWPFGHNVFAVGLYVDLRQLKRALPQAFKQHEEDEEVPFSSEDDMKATKHKKQLTSPSTTTTTNYVTESSSTSSSTTTGGNLLLSHLQHKLPQTTAHHFFTRAYDLTFVRPISAVKFSNILSNNLRRLQVAPEAIAGLVDGLTLPPLDLTAGAKLTIVFPPSSAHSKDDNNNAPVSLHYSPKQHDDGDNTNNNTNEGGKQVDVVVVSAAVGAGLESMLLGHWQGMIGLADSLVKGWEERMKGGDESSSSNIRKAGRTRLVLGGGEVDKEKEEKKNEVVEEKMEGVVDGTSPSSSVAVEKGPAAATKEDNVDQRPPAEVGEGGGGKVNEAERQTVLRKEEKEGGDMMRGPDKEDMVDVNMVKEIEKKMDEQKEEERRKRNEEEQRQKEEERRNEQKKANEQVLLDKADAVVKKHSKTIEETSNNQKPNERKDLPRRRRGRNVAGRRLSPPSSFTPKFVKPKTEGPSSSSSSPSSWSTFIGRRGARGGGGGGGVGRWALVFALGVILLAVGMTFGRAVRLYFRYAR